MILVMCDSADAQWLPHVTRMRRVCTLSGDYDYEANRLSQPVSRLTFPGVLEVSPGAVVAPAGGGDRRVAVRNRVFPLREKTLSNDHCSVSKVVVTLSENGRWTVDMLARQDPSFVDEAERAKFQLFEQNRFHLILRPMTAEAGLVPDGVDAVSAPAVAIIRVKPFWIERGKSAQIREEGSDDRVAERFESIKVIAVDLQYQ